MPLSASRRGPNSLRKSKMRHQQADTERAAELHQTFGPSVCIPMDGSTTVDGVTGPPDEAINWPEEKANFHGRVLNAQSSEGAKSMGDWAFPPSVTEKIRKIAAEGEIRIKTAI